MRTSSSFWARFISYFALRGPTSIRPAITGDAKCQFLFRPNFKFVVDGGVLWPMTLPCSQTLENSGVFPVLLIMVRHWKVLFFDQKAGMNSGVMIDFLVCRPCISIIFLHVQQKMCGMGTTLSLSKGYFVPTKVRERPKSILRSIILFWAFNYTFPSTLSYKIYLQA